MSVAEGPEEEVVVQPNLKISNTPYAGQVVDSRKVDFDGLATYVPGQKWTVDYFSQVQGRDSAPASFQDGLPAAFGQYRVIRGLELIVGSPLTANQTTDTSGLFDLTGDGTIPSCVTPDNGDFFIAQVGNGKNAIFQVNEPKRLGIYVESNHSASWASIRWVDKALMERINKDRVVQTLYFIKENYHNGVKCLLSLEEVEISRRLGKARSRLINLYFKGFFDDVFETFVFLKDGIPVYDPAVTKFMKGLLETTQHKQVAKITEHGVSHDVFSNQWTLFDALLKRDAELLYSCSQHMAISHISALRQRPWFASIAFSGIKQVVTALDVGFSVNNGMKVPHANLSIDKFGVGQPDMRSILPELDLDGSEPRPDYGSYIHRVVKDDYYVFTKAFYEDTEGMSQLEQLALDCLKGKTMDLKMLADIADYAVKFDNLERFYYIPVILALIKLSPGVF